MNHGNVKKKKKLRANVHDHRMKATFFFLAVPVTVAERHKRNSKLYTALEACGGILNIRS